MSKYAEAEGVRSGSGREGTLQRQRSTRGEWTTGLATKRKPKTDRGMEGREQILTLVDGGVLRKRGRKRKKGDEDVTLKVRGV